jgi:hypothetical protein
MILGEEIILLLCKPEIVTENARQLLERIKAKERNKETF